MNIEKNIKEDILERAERLLHYNNLLIEQCDKWLSEEEGKKHISERREKERKRKINKTVFKCNTLNFKH